MHSLLWLNGKSDPKRRETGTVGFAGLFVVTLVPLVMALAAPRNATIAWATVLLVVASVMCLGPLAAWWVQIHGQVSGRVGE